MIMTPEDIREIPGLAGKFGFYDPGVILDHNFIKPTFAEVVEIYDQVCERLKSKALWIRSYNKRGGRDCENIAISVLARVSETFSEKYPGEESRAVGMVWGPWHGEPHAWNYAECEDGGVHMNYGKIYSPSDQIEIKGGIFI